MGTPIRIALFALALMVGIAQAVDLLVISSGSDRVIPITVAPSGFRGGNVLPEDMSNTIDNDLCNSGYFEPLPRQSMISQSAQASEVISRDQKAVGVNYVTVGNIVSAGGRLQVQYALFNVDIEQQALTGGVTGDADQLCDMSYYIADQSLERLTDIKGTFPTKILYATAKRFSVDSTRYTSQRSGYDGARPVTLLQSRGSIVSPCFSPDGHRVVYVSLEQKRPRIFIRYVDIGRREQITNFEGLNGVLAFSPDGNHLAFVLSRDGNPEIYVMDLGSCALRRLTNNLAIDAGPFWGKDNSTLYFISDRSDKPQIYKMNVNSGTMNRVTFTDNYNVNPKLSVDEKTLIMVHRQQGYTNFQIAAQDLQRGNLWVLSNTTLDGSLTAAPNGTMLIYATRQQDRDMLMFVPIDGCIRIPLPTAQGDVHEPS